MTHIELQNLQNRLNFDGVSMAACLGIDHEQYRRYFYGKTSIPPTVERAALELENIEIMRREMSAQRIDNVPLGMNSGDYCG